MPKPLTLQRARATSPWFGKYQGRTLAEIGRIDRGYLGWLATDADDDTLRQAARLVLEGQGGRP